nr:hypothetical protein [Nitrosomonas nitrosa]
MDDWNRTRREWKMNCDQCTEDYVLYHFQAYESGIPYEGARWVRAEAYAEFKRLNGEAKTLCEDANRLAEQRYLPRWLSIFSRRSKKAVWEILTDSGKRYPSLGTFYKHVGHEGLDAYLIRQFRQDTAQALSIIGVTDAEIQRAWDDAKRKTDEAARLIC